MHTDISILTTAQIDAILTFLPAFEQPDFLAGTWHTPAGGFPFWASRPEVQAFLQTLSDTGCLLGFDWVGWSDEAQRFTDGGAAALADADLLTLRKLLTTYVRADRFNEGVVEMMFTNGQIVAILRRLREIRAAMA